MEDIDVISIRGTNSRNLDLSGHDSGLDLDGERMIQDSASGHLSSGKSSSSKHPSADGPVVDPVLCEWRIAGTHGEKIVLNISMLDVPRSHGCMSDYLEVRDGHWLHSKLLGKQKWSYPMKKLHDSYLCMVAIVYILVG